MHVVKSIKYCCDVCGACFDDEEKASRHESAHIKPVSINSWRYKVGEKYPYKVIIKMGDGTVMTYEVSVNRCSCL